MTAIVDLVAREALEARKKAVRRESGLFGKVINRIRAFGMRAHFRDDPLQPHLGAFARRGRRRVHNRQQKRQGR